MRVYFLLKVYGYLKTVNIMTNTKLIFISSIDENTELECYVNSINEVTLEIINTDSDHPFNSQLVSLDVPTAIKLSKVLRNNIAEVKDNNFDKLSNTF